MAEQIKRVRELLDTQKIKFLAEPAILADTKTPGLELRYRNVGGKKVFTVTYRLHGRLVRQVLGDWPKYTLKQARQDAEDARVKARKGVDPQAKKRELSASSTVVSASPVSSNSAMSGVLNVCGPETIGRCSAAGSSRLWPPIFARLPPTKATSEAA